MSEGIMSWEEDPILICDNDDCGFMTGIVKEAMDHAFQTAHSISGPGKIEGTTLTVSLVRDEEDDEREDT
jgi:hypothetical protein